MAWTLETYNGAQAIGNPSNLALCMYDLFHGIRQRQAAAGLAVTNTAIKADGTSGVINSYEDFVGLPIVNWHPAVETPVIPSLAYVNLVQVIQARILALIDSGKFVKSSGSTDVIDRDWVSSQIGYSITATLEKPLDHRFWQAMQDCLDLLLYTQKDVQRFVVQAANPDLEHVGKGSALNPTASGAWSAMISDPQDATNWWLFPASFRPPVRTSWKLSFNGSTYFATSTWYRRFKISIPETSGVVVAARYYGLYLAQRCLIPSIDISIGDAAKTLDLTSFTGDLMPAIPFETDAFPIVLNETGSTEIEFDATISTPYPSSPPFNPGPVGAYAGEIAFSVTGIRLWFDISSELDDQN